MYNFNYCVTKVTHTVNHAYALAMLFVKFHFDKTGNISTEPDPGYVHALGI